MKKSILITTIATLLLTACGGQKPPKGDKPADAISLHQNELGDSTRYGLACDGCTDSILVFLPFSGGDPDTFDIIEARKQDRIFGRPRVGDELAVIVHPERQHEALMAINLNQLEGKWCYMVTPTLRQSADGRPLQLPDSIRQRILIPREYGIRLRRDYTAYSMGGLRQTTTDDSSPAKYPDVKHYTEWRIHNGAIILKADTIPGLGQQTQPENDTVTIELLRRDTLVLRFADHVQGYYRQK